MGGDGSSIKKRPLFTSSFDRELQKLESWINYYQSSRKERRNWRSGWKVGVQARVVKNGLKVGLGLGSV